MKTAPPDGLTDFPLLARLVDEQRRTGHSATLRRWQRELDAAAARASPDPAVRRVATAFALAAALVAHLARAAPRRSIAQAPAHPLSGFFGRLAATVDPARRSLLQTDATVR